MILSLWAVGFVTEGHHSGGLGDVRLQVSSTCILT